MSKHRHLAPNGDVVRPVMRMPGRRMEWHAEDGTIYARAQVRREQIETPKGKRTK